MSYRDLSLSLASALVNAQKVSGRPSPDAHAGPPAFTITISRESGALGSAVAAEVGQRLGWPVYDRNLLDKIADEFRHRPPDLDALDERPPSWLEEALCSLFDRYPVGSDAYLRHLFAVVRGLGNTGACVIVGRGANFLLPAETTLRVRLVASPEDRARVAAERQRLSPTEAADWVRRTERERAEFIKRVYNADPADAHHYDLVLNMSRLSVADAADLIADTLRRLQRGRAVPPREAAPAAVPALA